MIVQDANFAANLSGNKMKTDMSHRRSHVIGKGSGAHAPELQKGNRRPSAPVKPVISRRQHGRPVKDNDVSDGGGVWIILLVLVGIIIAAIYFLAL